MKKIIYLFIFLSQLATFAWAQSSFVVNRIEIVGLQRISAATVESYLPIKRGDHLRPAKTAEIVRALYRTGFFERINLSKRDHTLIIYVTERPTIGQLTIKGNSVIPTDKLTEVMRSLDIAEGRVYNPAILDRIKQGLLNQYYQLGRYNARVDVTVTPLSRNRVSVRIDISEGLIAKIRRINIIGNHAFSERTLIRQLDIATSGVFSFFTQSDRYSEAQLEQSLEKLKAYYLDHGYIRVEVRSSQAEVTPDRKSVYITIVIDEGEPYTVKDFKIEGDLVLPQEAILSRITIHPGDPFSRKKVIQSEKAITDYYGSQSYLFATIALRPKVDDAKHEITLIFDINPGKRAYVRQVTFSDNNHTNDVVLRREVTQMEAAPASTVKLEESKHRLSMLPYLKSVDMSVRPVPALNDQIDVNYRVKEDSSAQVSFKVGYSQAYGALAGGGFNQKNFLGTGNTLGLNLNYSRYERFLGFEYANPYYTEDGISRTINLSVSMIDPSAIARMNNGYSTNEYNFGVLYGIPIGQEEGAFNRIIAGVNYQNTLILLNQSHLNNVSKQVNSFVARHGRRFREVDFKVGYSRDSRDRAIFPTRGTSQSTFLDFYVPASRGSLTFYTFNYQGKWYQPLYNQFILLSKADFGYGNALNGARNYPFFKNYFAGGIGSVRGYQDLTLGPLDSNAQAYGGNILVDASLALILPTFITDSVRTSLFVDAGNVYGTLNNRQFGCTGTGPQRTCSTNSGPIRFSAGLGVDWLTPFGPVQLSLATPLNKRRPPDKPDYFQFSLGANF